MQQDPGDGQPLLLPAGQPVPALADHGGITVGELHDPVVDIRRPRRLLHLRQRSTGTPITDVGQDGVVEQVTLLGHEADGGGQRGLPDVPHVEPV